MAGISLADIQGAPYRVLPPMPHACRTYATFVRERRARSARMLHVHCAHAASSICVAHGNYHVCCPQSCTVLALGHSPASSTSPATSSSISRCRKMNYCENEIIKYFGHRCHLQRRLEVQQPHGADHRVSRLRPAHAVRQILAHLSSAHAVGPCRRSAPRAPVARSATDGHGLPTVTSDSVWPTRRKKKTVAKIK